MKTREEQIAEMVEIMCDDFGASFFAERLYDAGYRKQSDTVKEFVERVKEVYDKYYLCPGGFEAFDLWLTVVYLAEKYGVEVEK